MPKHIAFALTLVAIGGCSSAADEPAVDECCDKASYFAEERTYDTGCDTCDGPTLAYPGEVLYFHPNGTVDWLPGGDILYRGIYSYCGGAVSVRVSSPGRVFDACMIISEDETSMTQEGARFERTQ